MTWDLSVVTACPFHSCLLLEECPKCHEPITWSRAGVSLCVCGRDWRDIQLKPIPSSETVVARLVYHHFALAVHENRSASNPLCHLDLASLFEALLFVAGHQEGHTDTCGWLTLPGRTTTEIHKKLLGGYAVFEAWPSRFHLFLDKMNPKKTRSKMKIGLKASFGNFYQDLYGSRLECEPAIRLLKSGFEKYVSETWDGKNLPRAKWAKKLDIRLKFLSKEEACDALQVDSRVLDSLVSEGKIVKKIHGTGQARSFVVEAASLDRKSSVHMSLRGAFRFLGLTQEHFLRLVENSLVVPVSTPSINDRSHWKFDRSLIQDFFARITSQVCPLRSYSNLELESFASALRFLNRLRPSSAQGIHNFVNDILRGEIIPRGESCREVGISRLLFCRREFNEYVRRKLTDQSDLSFQLQGASKEFKLTKKLIYFLAGKGLIESNDAMEGDRAFRAISPKAVESFQAKYVLAFELARTLDMPTQVLLQELQRLEIEPVSGASIDFGEHYVFKRVDIEQLDLKNVTHPARKKVQERRECYSVDIMEAANILSVHGKIIYDLVSRDVLTPCRDSKGSPNGYKFTREHIESFKGQFKDLGNLTSMEAAIRVLGRYHLRTKWLRMGFIKYKISKDGKRRLLNNLDVESIASFMARVVGRSEAARVLGMNLNSMGYWIRKGTLRPVSDLYSRAFEYPLFSKAEVARFKALISGVKSQNGRRSPNRIHTS